MLAQKWRAAGQKVEQDCTQTINIGCGPEILDRSLRLLGSDVARRPEYCQGSGQIARGVEPLCQAKIANQRFATAIEQDISRFQVAVQNTLAVRILDCARYFRHQA